MSTRKKLPLGIQDFAELIEKDYLYVDKTEYVYRLVSESKLNFLSRPRRFGKSVLLSTFEALFAGRRELFQGLYIADRWNFKAHPVIRLDLLGIRSESEQVLERDIGQRLKEQAQRHGLKLSSEGCANLFRELILKLAERDRVVVLIDEYDKPILDHITDKMRAEANKKFLANFYAVLKSVEKKLEFLFMTGVSKFTRVSLFSELNNLTDLTLHPDYAGVAGYTDSELDHFAAYLDQEIDGFSGVALRTRIKTWYDGYSWDGITRVTNPVSLLNLLDQKRFAPFWFSTGTPRFLIECLRSEQVAIPELANMEIEEFSMDGFEPEHLDPIALLFQTGYLTIKEVCKTANGTTYRMGYPNFEVKRSFLIYLLANFTDKKPGQLGVAASRIGRSLSAGDIEAFCQGIQNLFAAIPDNIFIADREAYYHTVIYLVLSLLGVDLACEIQTNKGRIDAVIETEDRFYVTEFKLGRAQEVPDQIKARDYADAYRLRGKAVFLLGIGIDSEQRNIADWQCVADP